MGTKEVRGHFDWCAELAPAARSVHGEQEKRALLRPVCLSCAQIVPTKTSNATLIGPHYCYVCSKLKGRQGADFMVAETTPNLEAAHMEASQQRMARTVSR